MMKLCRWWATAPHGCGLSNASGCTFCKPEETDSSATGERRSYFPECNPPSVMYSDGKHRPQCPVCLRVASDEAIWTSLIHPTTAELRAEYKANEFFNALTTVRRMLASGRTVGNDSNIAALKAENYIIGLLDERGGSHV